MVDHCRTLTAAVLLMLLPLLAHCQGSKVHKVSQGTTTESLAVKASSSTQPAASTDSDTAPFTTARNTYYRGSVVLNVTNNVDTPEDCLSLCVDDTRCEFWSHCPSNMTTGCDAVKVCTTDGNATIDSLEAGTCILSRNKELVKVILSVEGDGVAWTGGMYAEKDDTRSPAPGGGPPVIAPSKSPSPPSTATEACPKHEVPTDWTIPASHDSIITVTGLSISGEAPPCFDLEADKLSDSPTSYAACRPQSFVNQNVQTLGSKLCDSTTGSNVDDANVTEAQALLFPAIEAGGQQAIDALAAVIYAQFHLQCWPGIIAFNVVAPPRNEVKSDTLQGLVSNILHFYTNAANAAEYAGMGLCTRVLSTRHNDFSTGKVLTTVHTGTGV